MPGLLLSEKEREQLVEYLKNINDQQARRGHLILLYDDGWLTYQAAEETGFSRSQARYWKHEFLLNRMSIFPGLPENPLNVTLDEGEPEGEFGIESLPSVEEKFSAVSDTFIIHELQQRQDGKPGYTTSQRCSAMKQRLALGRTLKAYTICA